MELSQSQGIQKTMKFWSYVNCRFQAEIKHSSILSSCFIYYINRCLPRTLFWATFYSSYFSWFFCFTMAFSIEPKYYLEFPSPGILCVLCLKLHILDDLHAVTVYNAASLIVITQQDGTSKKRWKFPLSTWSCSRKCWRNSHVSEESAER